MTFTNFYDAEFFGVDNIGEYLIIEQVENNTKNFLDWGFLNIGGFINVHRSQNNIYGNTLSKLKATEDPNYSNGQVWQTMRKDWVWESGITYQSCVYPVPSPLPATPPTYDPYNPCPSEYLKSVSPISISGIYINNVFYPANTTGQYAYVIDYINSRIIFNNPIPLASVVEMEYAYRWVQVYKYDNAKWWQQLQYKTDNNAEHFNQFDKGDFSLLSNNRIQLPAIIIETISRGVSKPFQLGDKSLIMKQELLLHIVAENMSDRNKIIDIIRIQQDRVINLYDTNLAIRNNVQPFNINGSLNTNRLQYNQLYNQPYYFWAGAKLIDIFASQVESFSPFFSECNLKLTLELIYGISK